MAIRLIYFDIDNTLIDFDGYVIESMREGFRKHGLRPYEDFMFDVFTRINNRMWEDLEEGKIDFPTIQRTRWNIIFQELGIEFDGVQFEDEFQEALLDSAIPVPHSLETLRELHGEYIIATASNGPYEQQLRRTRLAGMEPYVDYAFISEKIGVNKPDPAFFEYAFREINEGREKPILPEECVIVGDSMTSDMGSGFACGMKTVFFNKKKLKKDFTGVDAVTEDLSEVPAIIRRLDQ